MGICYKMKSTHALFDIPFSYLFIHLYVIDYDTEFESLLLLSTHPSPRGVCYSDFVTVGLNSIICSLCSLVCPFQELFCYKMKLTHALYWHSLFLSFHSPRTRNLKVVCAFENPFTICTLHQWLDIILSNPIQCTMG